MIFCSILKSSIKDFNIPFETDNKNQNAVRGEIQRSLTHSKSLKDRENACHSARWVKNKK